jgi:hypothetical protein
LLKDFRNFDVIEEEDLAPVAPYVSTAERERERERDRQHDHQQQQQPSPSPSPSASVSPDCARSRHASISTHWDARVSESRTAASRGGGERKGTAGGRFRKRTLTLSSRKNTGVGADRAMARKGSRLDTLQRLRSESRVAAAAAAAAGLQAE